jgi:hypothetical protein
MDNSIVKSRWKLEKRHIARAPHPPYSPDLSPCDFWWFEILKQKMKERVFQSEEQILAAITESWNKLTFEDIQRVFHNWMECSIWVICQQQRVLPMHKCLGLPLTLLDQGIARRLRNFLRLIQGVSPGYEHLNIARIKLHSSIMFIWAYSVYSPLVTIHFLSRSIHSGKTACKVTFSIPSRTSSTAARSWFASSNQRPARHRLTSPQR